MKTFSLFFLTILFAFFALLSGCNKDEELVGTLPVECSVQATFQDFSGLDGCGFLLIMEDGGTEQVLEPINLMDFELEPTDGMVVCIDFTMTTDAASICMGGTLVELNSILPID